MKIKKIGCGCLVIILTFLAIIFIMSFFINRSQERKRLEEENYRENYIEDSAKLAVRIAKRNKLFPSVMIAQSIL